ncbi:MAG: hypothetical protein Q9195_002947 [Heterodermia aff. obscurata]
MAILGVIVIGCFKVIYNHYRLRKYTKLAAMKERHRQAIQQRPSVRARKGREIPFGVRAIESGIEVDGVWISKSNTPYASTSGSPASSIVLEPNSTKYKQGSERNSVAQNQRALDMPQPIHGHPIPGQGRTSTSPYLSGPPMDPQLDPERLPRSSTVSDNVSRARPTYQPRRSSGLRFSNSNDNSTALAALEGRRMAPTPELVEPQGTLEGVRPRRVSSSGSGSNSSEEHYTPRRPGMKRDSSDILFDPTYLPSGVPRASNDDHLNYLASHRRSHAAEEGQLLPRIRPNNTHGRSTSDVPLHRGQFSTGRISGEDASNPFATPLGTPRASTKSGYVEEPPSFASFVNSSSSPDSRIEAADDVEYSSSDLRHTSNALQQGDGNRQHRQSQIARKINSGLEILRPGSFSRPRESVADWNEKAQVGDEHQSGGAEGPANKRHSKKLQRKRADSKESRFREEV